MNGKRIKNIWLLLLYASELYKNGYCEQKEIEEAETNPDKIPGLVAEILVDAVQRRLRRDLSLKYGIRSADLTRLRGTIDLLRTETESLLKQGRIACTFEEMTVDTPTNRFVRATLVRLATSVWRSKKFVNRSTDVIGRCRAAAARLRRAGVGYDASLDLQRVYEDSSLGRTSRLDVRDKRMLAAARLALALDLPIANPDDYGESFWELFEKAIFGFYNFHRKDIRFGDRNQSDCGFTVDKQKTYDFQIDVLYSDPLPRDEVKGLIPKMRPDIVFTSSDRRIILDTKYTNMTKAHRGKSRFVSNNIYQLYTYLSSREDDNDAGPNKSDGILLYVSDEEHDETEMIVDVRIQDHNIRFASVDLNADSKNIRKRLLDVVSKPFGWTT